ncbi:MAG: RNA 3'-terminal phosphate cyclase [Pyrinomonadaceae bacterium MAG19_C2-C3]|nr:RNA 3'-terminal phosphate cyclase [Pyrinomonadaceae bacterium MAG19_C2-C3]
MIVIDGSQGEGGGQILRTSLALALVTGKRFRIERIRANREKPGLLRQHLTAVLAASEVGGAGVEGAMLGSSELTFVPRSSGRLAGGDYHFSIGTAGSTSLVLQTILPALALAENPSTVTLEGGTHNQHAPPFDFIARAFLPVINRMGAGVTAELERYGFYPAGGGCVRVSVEPAKKLARLELNERGAVRECRARAVVANLERGIAEREIAVVREKLGWSDERLHIEQVREARSPGNYVSLEIESEHVCEVFTGIGARGVMAETVAEAACDGARVYLASEAAVGEHLADQLLLPMALAGGGSFTTNNLSLHATTNIEVIKRFLDIEISVAHVANHQWQVNVG